ncbi:transposase, putative [Roseobacter sp. SK209-2-6]|nr:transposase, putative [Roseobacter sp. SK209-2-6]
MAKDPRFTGAYVGNRPDAKQENYMSRAIPLSEFVEVLAEKMEEHNARPDRRSDTAKGRSFDETFAESYATAPILKATEEQRNLWLMGQATGKLHKRNGSLTFHENVYHCAWMSQEAGKQVVFRFDPEDLHSGVHVYQPTGEHLGFAECLKKVDFFNLEGARTREKQKRDIAKAEKKLASLHAPISPKQLAADMNAGRETTDPTPLAEAKVVSLVFANRVPATSFKSHRTSDAAQEALILELNTGKAKPKARPRPGEFKVPKDPEQRFQDALDLMERQRAGKPLGVKEASWLEGYFDHPEFEARFEIHKSLGGNNAG